MDTHEFYLPICHCIDNLSPEMSPESKKQILSVAILNPRDSLPLGTWQKRDENNTEEGVQ